MTSCSARGIHLTWGKLGFLQQVCKDKSNAKPINSKMGVLSSQTDGILKDRLW